MFPEQSKKHVKRLASSLNCNNRLFQFARFMDGLNTYEVVDIIASVIDYSKNEKFFEENYIEFTKTLETQYFHYEFRKTFGSLTAFMQDDISAINYADIMAHIFKYFELPHMKYILTTLLHDDLSQANHLDVRDIILGHFTTERYSPLTTYVQNILPIHSIITDHESVNINRLEEVAEDAPIKFYRGTVFILYDYDEYTEYPKIVSVTRKRRFSNVWLNCARYYENFNDKMVAIE